jgi:3-deoxy-D-manno-octulosonate 8-phosphate phosphatase (KDO 8-P phosphatase)
MPETDFRRLQLLVLDVDGVMTDGRIILTPDGQEIKAFDSKDGAGIKYWIRAGGQVAFISGRGSAAVQVRADDLGVQVVRMHAKDKLPVYREVLAELGLGAAQAVVMGDDLPDLPLLRECGFSAAPSDAVPEIRQAVDYITTLAGGRGCVREVIDLVLRRSGRWGGIMARYVAATPLMAPERGAQPGRARLQRGEGPVR